jgi:regulation of enolase protein 1 (concanavalin A-like superfamily)
VQNTNAYAKVGLMMRETPSADSRHASMLVTPGDGVHFSWRETAGQGMGEVKNQGFAAPIWLKLTRVGKRFTGYRSTDGVNWTQVGYRDVNMGASILAGMAGNSHNNTGLGTHSFDNVSLAPTPGWTESEAGVPYLTGNRAFAGVTHTVQAAGAKIGGGISDEMHFSHQYLSGDGQILARVSRPNQSYGNGRSGLMFRESLEAGARYAFVARDPALYSRFSYRPTAFQASTDVTSYSGLDNYWLKLDRSGNTFTAWHSGDASNWAQIGGAQTIALTNPALVGLAAASGSVVLKQTTFDNVTILRDAWADADIGGPSPAGSSTVASPTLTVRGGGADIWGASDQFHYRYRVMQGDGQFTVRVTGVPNTNAWAKAGIMIRETLEPGSANAYLAQSAASGRVFQWRNAANGNGQSVTVAGSAPYWLRLARSGDRYTGFTSTDGSAWTQIGSAVFPMGRSAYIGLAVTSHAQGTLCSATFTNVQ